MSYWILKTEPSSYAFDNLLKDKKATWDGVRNSQALNNIRSMRKGDHVMIYHTGEIKRIVGLAQITSEPYADPKSKDPAFAVVDLAPIKKIAKEVSLAEIKADPYFKDLKLVRQSRLSVIPVPDAMWKRIMKLAGEN